MKCTNEDDNLTKEIQVETLFGLVGSISSHLSPSTLSRSCNILETAIQSSSKENIGRLTYSTNTNQTDLELRLSQLSHSVAREFCLLSSISSIKRKQSWNALQEFSQKLLHQQSQQQDQLGHMASSSTNSSSNDGANALAISFVFGALAMNTAQRSEAKAATSALSSTVSRNKALLRQFEERSMANHALRAFLVHASYGDTMNLNTITQFARAFKLTEEDELQHAALVSQVAKHVLQEKKSDGWDAYAKTAPQQGDSSIDDDQDVTHKDRKTAVELYKLKVAGVMALVCQIRPWASELSPLEVVQAGIPFDYWHAAELVCQSAHGSARSPLGRTPPLPFPNKSSEIRIHEAEEAVKYLVDSAMEEKTYRRADNLATNLYEQGGKSRYLKARYFHACDTIAKVVHKRQLPIIERQVDRVDKAEVKVRISSENNGNSTIIVSNTDDEMEADTFSPSLDIRTFALGQLHEAGEVDSAHRLALLWGMDYTYDENAIKKAAMERRKRYLQYDEVLPGTVPDLISDPKTLRSVFVHFWGGGPYPRGPFGLDAEWEEDTSGVDLLQLSHPKQALLIDVPTLISTKEGVESLRETVGALFDCSESVIVGFACRQDLSRLRKKTGSTVGSHWITGIKALVDAQQLVTEREPDFPAKVGLARVCEHYFGKPLDKAEQCSFWGARPLTERQRSYAALDAWVCAGVYEKLS